MADIRSFFAPKGTKKKTVNGGSTSSSGKSSKSKSDDKPVVKEKKRRIVIESDSDSEDPIPEKLKNEKEEPKKRKPSADSSKNVDKGKKEKTSLKPTTATDFFGSSNSTSSSTKRKQPESPIPQQKENKPKESKETKEISETPPKKKKKTAEEELTKIKTKELTQTEPKTVETLPPKKKNDPDEILMPDDDDDFIIAPTPEAKKSSSKKLGDKMKDAKSSNKVEDKINNNVEDKMKEGLKEYIEKSKQKQKNDKKKEPVEHEEQTPNKKKPTKLVEDTPDSSVKPETPNTDKKKNYWSYKNREGPSALGSKELPKASENCLAGKTFVLTGVLDAFERDTVEDQIKRYGGRVTGGVSGKTTYVIVGKEPGQSKMDKAAKHKTKQLDEDGFIELLKSFPPPDEDPQEMAVSIQEDTPQAATPNIKGSAHKSSPSVHTPTPSNKTQSQKSTPGTSSQRPFPSFGQSPSSFTPKSLSLGSQNTNSPRSQSSTYSQSPSLPKKTEGDGDCLLWVDKYKPKEMREIVGQHGDKSNAKKLRKWLMDWRDNHAPKPPGAKDAKPKKNFMAGKEDGSIFRAALLSGSPGLGKTTTATIVCKELGFSYVEMNASDTRGKKALETVIKESLSNVAVTGMLQGENNGGKKHCLLMDEVDGMAGNEDRGGMNELIQLIKKSKIPIICMCNDRNSQKVRSLANYCFDLRFYKPRVDQIKSFALKVACREGLKIPPQAIEQIIIGANQDIRQVLHNMQMWTATKSTLSYDEAKDNAKQAAKNIKLGPFDIVKNLFTHSDASKMTLNGKTDLFFNDYSFVPLFVQQNYLNVKPNAARDLNSHLDLISKTADAIADGNLVERSIRSDQSWSLLPLQGLFSTVLPSNYMSGGLTGRIDFPQWLGKNSSRNKHDRILQELKTHLALSANCMKSDINLDYLSTFKHRLGQPLTNSNTDANSAAKEVIEMMESYNLTREDWDSVMEIGKWGNEPDITSKIPTKVKSAFTRLYNKETHKNPYASTQPAKKAKSTTAASDGDVLIQDGDKDETQNVASDNEKEDDDISKDGMVKMKKETTASKSKTQKKTGGGASSSKTKTKGGASSSKGKGKAKK
ncbi:replication factor C subunit 1-like [Clytia hemisphaerica]|uniref:Replication factor C subunit 1 n=1 Tax=Clytia hemisphaerica TaxID=252671 RepID=A0A7M5UAT8_9CNID